MAKAPIPAMAAEIALAELDPNRESFETAAELWGDMSDDMRRSYRRMAVAAKLSYEDQKEKGKF